MKYVSFLIKPASGLCNMRCQYCFYEDETRNRQTASMGLMSSQTAGALIREAFSAVDRGGTVSFAFQGGEPTLAGLDFFRDFTSQVRAQNAARVSVSYSIQTNGLSIDREWAGFFREEGFLAGVSLDGDKALHDLHRADPAGKGTYVRIARAVELLLRAGVEVNLLCVVTRPCAHNPARVYHALRKTGANCLQFIPCLDPLGEPRGGRPWSLTPEDYASFLCGLFDIWYQDWERGRYASVRPFDDYVRLAMGLPAGTCAASGSCGSYFVCEADGSLYPCDFYALDQWNMGRLGQAPLEELARGETARRFLARSQNRPSDCRECPWRSLCFGGCPRDWVAGPDAGETRNYYCSAFRSFFAYAGERIYRLARMELAARRGF